ncbi:MAG: sulfite exporter TauE/SafE family protein [Bdellovibrionaceae bacterium]|nr:sulfite exporter TauE/SafE family protein [Pseudobdellovibrionaceae bacterium]
MTAAIGILVASFLGSWHCAGMCGPIAVLASGKNKLLSYQMGRLGSYSLLGFLAGGLGEGIRTYATKELLAAFVALMSLLLLWQGLRLLQNKSLDFVASWTWLRPIIRTLQIAPPFVMGALTGFLPCGWLWSFLLAASVTASATTGALVLALFWLGSVPALSALPVLLRRSQPLKRQKQQRTAGLILIGAAFYSLIVHTATGLGWFERLMNL